MDDDLGEQFVCESCDLRFQVLASNDAEIMAGGSFVQYCPRCGELVDED